MIVDVDLQGRTTALSSAGWIAAGELLLGRQESDGSIILERCRVERTTP